MSAKTAGDGLQSAALLDAITEIVSRAAGAILAIDPAALATQHKADHSPVTTADLAAQSVIAEGLARAVPELPVIGEETAGPQPSFAPGAAFALVDPLDGTREFIAGRPEYTVNVAVVRDGVPVLGVVAAPALGMIWRGIVGTGAERMRLSPGQTLAAARERVPIATRRRPADGVVAAVSRSHFDAATDAFLQRFTVASRLVSGSALKFCRVAEGAADIYPRLAPTSEWDLAAGHAIVVAAGGTVTDRSGQPLTYGHRQQRFLVPGFVAFGDPGLVDALSA
jgi:3'(2'), 5'-bisphosphate nucleotidase